MSGSRRTHTHSNLQLAGIADVSFPFSTSKRARLGLVINGEMWGGVRKKMGEKEEGVERKGIVFHFLPHPFPLIFSHSLAVSFPLRAFGNDRLQHRLPTVKNQRYARWKAKVPYVEHWTSKYVKSDAMKSNHFCCVIRPMVYFL